MECFCKSNPLSAPASSASFDCVAKHESLVPLVDGLISRHFSTRSQLHMGHVKSHLLLVQPGWMMSNCFFICSHDSHDINFFICRWCFSLMLWNMSMSYFSHQDLKASIRAVKMAMSIEMCLGRNFCLCWVELIAYGGFLKLGYPQIIHFYMILQDFPLTIQLLGYLHLWNPHMHPYAHSRGN